MKLLSHTVHDDSLVNQQRNRFGGKRFGKFHRSYFQF